MTIDREGRQFRLLTVHCVLWSFATSLASGFVGAYLLKLGFSLAATILLYAVLLGVRFSMRAVMLPFIRRLGMRKAILAGTAIAALQYLPLIHADQLPWLGAWILIVSAGECIYWPIRHAANAVCGGGGNRGSQIAVRQMMSTAISVFGPLAGGMLLSHVGAAAVFGIATVVSIVSAAPLLRMGELALGAVPTVRQSLKVADPLGLCAFAADGWMSAGLAIAWPMILFSTLGSSYDLLGWASSGAALAGALAGLGCGLAIDRGYRQKLSGGITATLLISVAMRAASAWAPNAALAANMVGAAAGGLYYPVLMSIVYDRAKRSGSAYQFHLSAEAGWDAGAILGCIATGAVAWTGIPVTFAVVPSVLGILAVHRCVREDTREAAGLLTGQPAAVPAPA